MTGPLHLYRDRDALVANWRALCAMSGTACGAAVKADGYGLGVTWVVTALAEAGCRDFFVASWDEAAQIAAPGLTVSVLHGVREGDLATAAMGFALPVLNTPVQVARWRSLGFGRCHVMLDTGINRLGLSEGDLAALDGLPVDIVMSHLASADEDVPLNATQRSRFVAMARGVPATRLSLANSAGIGLGMDYGFDLARPGLALYGGVPRPELAGVIRQVAWPSAEVLQRRTVRAGETVGYNATWTAPADTEVAILHYGYADGYYRGFSGTGRVLFEGDSLKLIGRVSMDLIAVDVTGHSVSEGDRLDIDFDLPRAASQSGMSQYELLTGLGGRFTRV